MRRHQAHVVQLPMVLVNVADPGRQPNRVQTVDEDVDAMISDVNHSWKLVREVSRYYTLLMAARQKLKLSYAEAECLLYLDEVIQPGGDPWAFLCTLFRELDEAIHRCARDHGRPPLDVEAFFDRWAAAGPLMQLALGAVLQEAWTAVRNNPTLHHFDALEATGIEFTVGHEEAPPELLTPISRKLVAAMNEAGGSAALVALNRLEYQAWVDHEASRRSTDVTGCPTVVLVDGSAVMLDEITGTWVARSPGYVCRWIAGEGPWQPGFPGGVER